MYDYTCQACNHTDEIILKVNDTDLRECPECGEIQYKRIISGGSGIIFKGGGFPGNDNRGKWHMKDSPEPINVGKVTVNGDYKKS